jgi:hypothetical protein
MNQESKVIKIILPGMCPHCNKEVMVAVKTITPVIDWMLRKEDLQNAKMKVIAAIDESDLSTEEKTQALDWVNNEDTIFGPEEVEPILDQILKKNES